MSLSPSQIERTKLTATFLNSIASGTVVAALIGPFVSIGMGITHPAADGLNLVGLSLFGLVLAIMVHLVARRVLLALED